MDASDEVREFPDVPEPLEGSNARATGEVHGQSDRIAGGRSPVIP